MPTMKKICNNHDFFILSAIIFLQLHIEKLLCFRCYELKGILICRCVVLKYSDKHLWSLMET